MAKNPFDGSGGKGGGSGRTGAGNDPNDQKNPQQAYDAVYGVELGGASGTPPGGLLPFDDIAKNVNPTRAAEQGVGSVGNSAMPFRLGGGKK